MKLFQNLERFDRVSQDTALLILHNPRVHYALSSGLLKNVVTAATKAANACASAKSKDQADAANLQIQEYNRLARAFSNFDSAVDSTIQRANQKYSAEYGLEAAELKVKILRAPIDQSVSLSGHRQVEFVTKFLPVDIGIGVNVKVNGTVSFLAAQGDAQADELASIMRGTVERVGDSKRVRFFARSAESSLIERVGRTDIVQCLFPLLRTDELRAEGLTVRIQESRQGLLQLSQEVKPGPAKASLSTALQWRQAKASISEVRAPSSASKNLVTVYTQAENELRAASKRAEAAQFTVTCPTTARHLRQIEEAHAEGGYDRALSFLKAGEFADYYSLGEEDASSAGFIRGTLAYMRRTGME